MHIIIIQYTLFFLKVCPKAFWIYLLKWERITKLHVIFSLWLMSSWSIFYLFVVDYILFFLTPVVILIVREVVMKLAIGCSQRCKSRKIFLGRLTQAEPMRPLHRLGWPLGSYCKVWCWLDCYYDYKQSWVTYFWGARWVIGQVKDERSRIKAGMGLRWGK